MASLSVRVYRLVCMLVRVLEVDSGGEARTKLGQSGGVCVCACVCVCVCGVCVWVVVTRI